MLAERPTTRHQSVRATAIASPFCAPCVPWPAARPADLQLSYIGSERGMRLAAATAAGDIDPGAAPLIGSRRVAERQ